MTDNIDTLALGDPYPSPANPRAAALINCLDDLLTRAIDGRITGLAYCATDGSTTTTGYQNLTFTDVLAAAGRLGALAISEHDADRAPAAASSPEDRAFEIETVWQEFNTAARSIDLGGDIAMHDVDDMKDSAGDLYRVAKDLAAQLAAAKAGGDS